MDILDLCYSLKDRDIVEVYVKRLFDEAKVGPMLLENVSHGNVEESSSAFSEVNEQSTGPNNRVGEDPFTTTAAFNTTSHSSSTPPTATFNTRSHPTTTPPTTTAAFDSRSHPTTNSPTTTAAFDTTSHPTTTSSTTTVATREHSTRKPGTTVDPTTEDVDDISLGPVESDFIKEEGFDFSTKDSVESEC
ncbi:uncharacterized protein LOC129892923 [Solanum dulcamara]|uniref:uncharacterized protein LOC129892923 n=1 Tax=Solanum dulcamara TaxID=45834 RepID=UPI00248673BC|nr:uncharacterized protein LOC129892923 [Solanum dulcamara]